MWVNPCRCCTPSAQLPKAVEKAVRERQETSRLIAQRNKLPGYDNPLPDMAKGVTKLHITYKPTTVSTVTVWESDLRRSAWSAVLPPASVHIAL